MGRRLTANDLDSAMIHRQPWFERRFTFDLPVSAAPSIIERLRGTPARVEHRLGAIPRERLIHRPSAEHWSIQENAGHLYDLESIWMTRVNDLAVGRNTLTPGDAENRQTFNANHNDHPLEQLLARFTEARAELVGQLEGADEADWMRSAMNQRIQKPMRLLDLAVYIAEHDDHHLATITELLRS
jgi:uncharacterized damage-inducible protein DinB